jgi:hypothetical protein
MKRLGAILLFVILVCTSSSYAQSIALPKTMREIKLEQEVATLKQQIVALENKEQELTEALKQGSAKQQQQIGELINQVELERRRSRNKDAEIRKLQQNSNQCVNELRWLNDRINVISNYYPLVIKSLKIGNTDYNGNLETEYGGVLYSAASMYLTPRIEYIALKDITVTLYIKLYMNGDLITEDSSPSGYSMKDDISVSSTGTVVLVGYGDSTKGYWPAGYYRYEIWYDNMCLKAVDFKLM